MLSSTEAVRLNGPESHHPATVSRCTMSALENVKGSLVLNCTLIRMPNALHALTVMAYFHHRSLCATHIKPLRTVLVIGVLTLLTGVHTCSSLKTRKEKIGRRMFWTQ